MNVSSIVIREAQRSDVEALVALEEQCFSSDRLSRRSFQNFVKPGPHQLLVAVHDDQVVGYSLLLFRTGTSLARIYSIAVSPAWQGLGIARRLLTRSEETARNHRCVFVRLEVNTDNAVAIALYHKLGYVTFDRVEGYYEDGSDALRLEKRVHQGGNEYAQPAAYYQQTTDFTCGPASLMMAMRALDEEYRMSRREELQIWREATTIFMTAGHGGCSPHGLALSAWRRGFGVTLYVNRESVPFIDGVRGEEKKAVLELVHRDFLEQIAESSIDLRIEKFDQTSLKQALNEGRTVLALISTWGLSRNKAPHWVFVADLDEDFVYIHDPDKDTQSWQNETDNIRVPIDLDLFDRMAHFGRARLKSFIVLSGPTD